MLKQLEDYLAEVARHIGSIPKPRRAEELREMRAHLVHAVAANRALGLTEDAAERIPGDAGPPSRLSPPPVARVRRLPSRGSTDRLR